MKILVTSQYYYPEPFRITDICEELVKLGHDVLVVTGPVTKLNRKPLEEIYKAIPEPKLVVAAGSCALMGGVYKNIHGDIPSEEIEGPVENIIPVDAKVPGCAVRPQDVLSGVVSILPKLLDAD